MTGRRWALLAAATLLLALLLVGFASGKQLGSDPFRDLTGGEAGGFMGRYPLSAYGLDTHIDTNDVLGVQVPGASTMEAVADGLASILWLLTALAVKTTISFVALAFSLDILNPHGALAPVSQAVQHLYSKVLGDPFMELMIVLLAAWLAKKGIWDRRHTEAIGQLALSFVYIFIALTLIYRAGDTIGQVASMTNQAASALLTGATSSATGRQQTKEGIADQLWRTQGFAPWVVLEFGGLRHCVNGAVRDADGYPESVPETIRGRPNPAVTTCRDHVRRVDGMGGYAIRFLRTHGDARDLEYVAIRDGEIPGGPVAAEQFAGYHVDKSDSPAVDIQQKGGGYSRLALAVAIAICSGLFCVLFGMVALATILVGILALFMYAFAPIAIGAAAIPGRGHRLFEKWGLNLIGLIVVKAFFAFALTALTTVSVALIAATGTQGWLYAFGLLAGLYLLIIVKRHWLMSLVGGATRHDVRHAERTVRSTSERAVAVGAMALASPLVAAKALAHRQPQERTPQAAQERTPQRTETAPQSPQPAQEATPQPPREGTPVGVPSPVHETMPGQPTAAAVPSEAQGSLASEQAGPSPVPSTEGARPAAPAEEGALQVTPPPVPGLPPGDGRAPAAPRQPPDPPFPGVNTPESVVSPQRREAHAQGAPQERAPHTPDLAPPPEYKGP